MARLLPAVLLLLVAVCAGVQAQSPDQPQLSKDSPNTPHCPPLRPIRHGAISYRNATDVLPLMATFSCALGTELRGNETSVCRRSGQWSHAQPTCQSIGLRAYPDRSGVASLGIISMHDEAILTGLAESAQKAHGAVGFTLCLHGKHRAFLLQEHESLTKLVPSARHHTYLFGPDGVLKRHVGFKAARAARLRPISFAADSSVLKGLRAAVLAYRAKNDAVIGFSVARGEHFRANLLGWSSLPLKPSKTRHSFVLRAEVEDQVVERGCFRGNRQGRSALRATTVLPEGTTIKSARLVCAAIAREKNHRYFAISERNCTSGNSFYGRYGRIALKAGEEAAYPCALSAAAASRRGISPRSASPLLIGAGAQSGAFHSFELRRGVLKVPDLFNGGFEEDEYLTPVYGEGAEREGKQSVVLSNAAGSTLSDWRVDALDGEVGLATYGSSELAQHTAFEGRQVVYFRNGGAITQTLLGLVPGRYYTLRFAETIRKDQAAGMTLQVRLGAEHVVYQNPFVSVPLWTKRRVHFKAPAAFVNLTIQASSSSLPGASLGFRPDATILLDALSLERRAFAAVKVGMVGRKNHGRVGSVPVTHPRLLKAFARVVAEQAAAGQGGVGFRVHQGAVSIVGKNDAATIAPFEGSAVYFSNGTVVRDATTKTASGFLSLSHPRVLRTLAHLSRRFSNSVGFSLRTDQRLAGGVEVVVLSSAAMPLERDEAYTTYFFDSGISDLGCWSVPSSGRLLGAVQPIKGRPVTKQSCADAAAKNEHDYFALTAPNGVPTCLTGRSDVTDKTDAVYYAGGRSSGCTVRCAGGKGNCGGSSAGVVFRLPLYSRVSVNGRASTFPLVLGTAQHRAAQEVFDRPGAVYFSSVSPADQRVAAKLAQAESSAESLGFEPVLSNSTQLQWEHALQYNFGGTQEYAVVRYDLQAPALTADHPATPTRWRLEGSKDGLNWTVIDRQEHVAFYTGQKRSFALRNTQAFHFHRLVVSENGGLGVPGFGIQGLTLYARKSSVRFLKALYRFEDAANVGWDTSFKNNDLQLFGGPALGQAGAVFNVTQAAGEVKVGKGSLKVANAAGAEPGFLAVDAKLSAPRGLPVRDHSFGVAFWFRVASQQDALGKFDGANAARRPDQHVVVSWGDPQGDAASNTIALDADFRAVRNSFGLADAAGLAAATQSDVGLLDEWHHYAVSFDAVTGRHRVWLDSKLVASRFYQNPAFSITPERFMIGVRSLATGGSDEFNGLLDDVAIFNGPLNTAAVQELSAGNFQSYLPLDCQGMSNEYLIESGVTWGRAPKAIQERYLRKKCYSKPVSCQTLSDQYGINPFSLGKAGYDARKAYQRQRCATWPSILHKRSTFAVCPKEKQLVRMNVFSRNRALELCNLQGYDCQAYVWGGKQGDASFGIAPFELRMCSTYLSDLQHSKSGVQITTRVSKYLLHPDSKMKCGQQDLPTHKNVPTSIHARWLCDSTPGCKGYVWAGKVGAHPSGRKATPGRLILCADLSGDNGRVYSFPGSGYEVGEKLGAYVVLAERGSQCSPFSLIGVAANVTTSLQARRECDRMDGSDDRPRCLSYAWDRNHREATLCSSVPQAEVTFLDDTETGILTPTSCQQMSDLFDIAHGQSFGFAPFEIRSMYHSQKCATRPRPCQALSNEYQLSPNVTKEIAAAVPGEVRDLWLRQRCHTYPEVKESQYFINATYADLQSQIDALKARIDDLNARIEQAAAENSPALPAVEKELLVRSLNQAKALVQTQLDNLRLKQTAELAPILQRAADSEATMDQTQQIHQIVAGLINASVANLAKRT